MSRWRVKIRRLKSKLSKVVFSAVVDAQIITRRLDFSKLIMVNIRTMNYAFDEF